MRERSDHHRRPRHAAESCTTAGSRLAAGHCRLRHVLRSRLLPVDRGARPGHRWGDRRAAVRPCRRDDRTASGHHGAPSRTGQRGAGGRAARGAAAEQARDRCAPPHRHQHHRHRHRRGCAGHERGERRRRTPRNGSWPASGSSTSCRPTSSTGWAGCSTSRASQTCGNSRSPRSSTTCCRSSSAPVCSGGQPQTCYVVRCDSAHEPRRVRSYGQVIAEVVANLADGSQFRVHVWCSSAADRLCVPLAPAQLERVEDRGGVWRSVSVALAAARSRTLPSGLAPTSAGTVSAPTVARAATTDSRDVGSSGASHGMSIGTASGPRVPRPRTPAARPTASGEVSADANKCAASGAPIAANVSRACAGAGPDPSTARRRSSTAGRPICTSTRCAACARGPPAPSTETSMAARPLPRGPRARSRSASIGGSTSSSCTRRRAPPRHRCPPGRGGHNAAPAPNGPSTAGRRGDRRWSDPVRRAPRRRDRARHCPGRRASAAAPGGPAGRRSCGRRRPRRPGPACPAIGAPRRRCSVATGSPMAPSTDTTRHSSSGLGPGWAVRQRRRRNGAQPDQHPGRRLPHLRRRRRPQARDKGG